MTPTQQTILACLTANVTNAPSKALRDFANTQLTNYRKHLEKQKPETRPVPNWDRFIERETP